MSYKLAKTMKSEHANDKRNQRKYKFVQSRLLPNEAQTVLRNNVHDVKALHSHEDSCASENRSRLAKEADRVQTSTPGTNVAEAFGCDVSLISGPNKDRFFDSGFIVDENAASTTKISSTSADSRSISPVSKGSLDKPQSNHAKRTMLCSCLNLVRFKYQILLLDRSLAHDNNETSYHLETVYSQMSQSLKEKYGALRHLDDVWRLVEFRRMAAVEQHIVSCLFKNYSLLKEILDHLELFCSTRRTLICVPNILLPADCNTLADFNLLVSNLRQRLDSFCCQMERFGLEDRTAAAAQGLHRALTACYEEINACTGLVKEIGALIWKENFLRVVSDQLDCL